MKKVLIAGLLSLLSGISTAATIITLDGNTLSTTMPTVEFDTSQNLLEIQSNESLNCSGGVATTPSLSILSVQVDNNPALELQSEIVIERIDGDTLVQIVTLNNDVVCSFVDEILSDGFEAPVIAGQPNLPRPRQGISTRG